MKPSALRDDALVGTSDGFALRLSLPWIRSLPLSCVSHIVVSVDGEPRPVEALIDGRRVPVTTLDREQGWWFVQDRLEVRAATGLSEGPHDVEVAFTLTVPYLHATPDAPLTIPWAEVRSLQLGQGSVEVVPREAPGVVERAESALPSGWMLAVSSFNWTPEIVAAQRAATEIVVDIARTGVADTIELEAGQVWRSFPQPSPAEVAGLREGLAEAAGSIAVVGLNLDEWSSPTRQRSEDERLAFLVPQIEAARRVGAMGVRLPLGQAGSDLHRRLLPLLHELDLTLFEEFQGQLTPQAPASRAAFESVMSLDDPKLRFALDISIVMPALPPSYLERLEAGGVPAALIARLADDWRDPATHEAVVDLLRSGAVPPAVHILYMDLLIRFGRSEVGDLVDLLPYTGAVHLKFWDLDDADGRVTQPIRDVAGAFSAVGYTGTFASEWGGHEWLDDDPTEITRRHLALAHTALLEGAS